MMNCYVLNRSGEGGYSPANWLWPNNRVVDVGLEG